MASTQTPLPAMQEPNQEAGAFGNRGLPWHVGPPGLSSLPIPPQPFYNLPLPL